MSIISSCDHSCCPSIAQIFQKLDWKTSGQPRALSASLDPHGDVNSGRRRVVCSQTDRQVGRNKEFPLLQVIKQNGNDVESAKTLARLQRQRDLIFAQPNEDLDDFAKKLRQATLKAQHMMRRPKGHPPPASAPLKRKRNRSRGGGAGEQGSQSEQDDADADTTIPPPSSRSG